MHAAVSARSADNVRLLRALAHRTFFHSAANAGPKKIGECVCIFFGL